MMKLKVKAYAKINLSVDVTGKLPNGYHLIDTVMQSISLCDLLTVRKTADSDCVSLNVENSDIDIGSDNTVLKAVKCFDEAYDTPRDFGLDIILHKNIPQAAGLGGGSADAAAMLAALNRLCNYPFSQAQLCNIAAKVGADVPFCTVGGTKRVQGIGERITPVSKLFPCAFLLIKNAQKGSTGQMYSKIDQTDCVSQIDILQTCRAIEIGDIKLLSENCGNIFLNVWDDPGIRRAMKSLTDSGALTAALSGSGPTVYGLFNSLTSAERAYSTLSEGYKEIFTAVPTDSGYEFV